MKVTLGGDRLGSGNKNKIALRNYERSTHNLSQRFTSSMQCGLLYPFLVEPAMRGDTFDINLAADGRTIPTKGPLFGSFKMQVDLFQCPFRLYQAILHNNPTSIGLKMNQVLLPKIYIKTGTKELDQGKMADNCLLKYLGLSGIGVKESGQDESIERTINAIPALAYYDIFKTYYANKQEENAYVVRRGRQVKKVVAESVMYSVDGDNVNPLQEDTFIHATTQQVDINGVDVMWNFGKTIYGWNKVYNIDMECIDGDGVSHIISTSNFISTYRRLYPTGHDISFSTSVSSSGNYILNLEINSMTIYEEVLSDISPNWANTNALWIKFNHFSTYTEEEATHLTPFKLKNIDDMRLAILSKNNMGHAFTLGYLDWDRASGSDGTGLPYSCLFDYEGENYKSYNNYALNGLVVKTYQSDLFNNWVNTEWIDGENGIAAITAISTSDGSFKIDSLNLAEKLYNMLNRIAVADGTYEGWQDAVYTESPKRHIESPIYLGGMSSEIVFEEIVQSAPTEDSPLGTLAGKGRILKRKGGHVHVKIDEASFIIGIVSLTPRINYTQGNAWYLTELNSMDDLHKPALDGIGFENLIGERLAWFDTKINEHGQLTRSVVGKVPAWINYMTAVDKGYGDFAQTDGKGFMLLQRNYEYDDINGGIKDVTTYIDPAKFNYAFAYTTLESQNFWIQIQSNITARRLMSAKQIPNI